jgi:hypothetical protein
MAFTQVAYWYATPDARRPAGHPCSTQFYINTNMCQVHLHACAYVCSNTRLGKNFSTMYFHEVIWWQIASKKIHAFRVFTSDRLVTSYRCFERWQCLHLQCQQSTKTLLVLFHHEQDGIPILQNFGSYLSLVTDFRRTTHRFHLKGQAVDVSGQHTGPIITGQAVQEYCKHSTFRDNLSVRGVK